MNAPQGTAWCYWHPDRQAETHCYRCGRPACQDCARVTSCAECARETAPQVKIAAAVSNALAANRLGVATFGIICALLAMLALQLVSGGDYGAVSLDLAMVNYRFFGLPDGGATYGVADGAIWRIATTGLLHFGLAQLALNLYALYRYGPPTEKMLGTRRFLALFATATVGASLTTYLFDSAFLSRAGAAGPVAGVLSCTLVLYIGRALDTRFLLVVLATYAAMAWFEVNGSGLEALAGGFIAGATFGFTYATLPRNRAHAVIAAFWIAMGLCFIVRTAYIHTTDFYAFA